MYNHVLYVTKLDVNMCTFGGCKEGLLWCRSWSVFLIPRTVIVAGKCKTCFISLIVGSSIGFYFSPKLYFPYSPTFLHVAMESYAYCGWWKECGVCELQ
jgi:hypothetical protein